MAAVTPAPLASHAPERRRIEGAGTDESTWWDAHSFDDMRSIEVADWSRRYRSVWVLAPHPDDEVLGIGGSLSALSALHVDLRIVSVTDGEASHRDVPSWTAERLAEVRHRELQRALEALGIEATLTRLGLPDGRVSAHRDALMAALVDVVDARDLLLATCRFDGHPDHEACGEVAQLVGELTGATVVEYPVWLWHWATPRDTIVPWDRACRLAVAPSTVLQKRVALDAFVSQLTAEGRHAAVLPPHVLPRYLRPFDVVFR